MMINSGVDTASAVARVRETMAAACARAGRKEEEVRLIAVTKFVEEERILPAILAGCSEVGENRAQDFSQKLTFFKQNGCTCHFIGQLQTNKIKYVCGKADLVHSVDRLPLAVQLSRMAAEQNVLQDILIQVNIGHEEQKGGAEVESISDLVGSVQSLPGLRIRGLMCVPPAVERSQVAVYFASLRDLRDRLQSEFPALKLEELSMGMSHDYDIAIMEGATMVRVGTGIFGSRYPNGVASFK